MIGVSALAWLGIALALHPIGDHYTESDFYGGYAQGARAIQHGHVDPERYGVIGPGYEFALALAGLAIPDLFTAGKLLSALSALVLLVIWRGMVAKRLGEGASAWAVALVAASPVFTRYAWSATTDMFGAALQIGTWAALLAARGFGYGFAAGALAAVATLTRYNAVYLLPAGAILLGPLRDATPAEQGPMLPGRIKGAGRASSSPGASGPAPPALQSTPAPLKGFILGVLAIAGPWLALSATDGHLPGSTLVSHYSFYASTGGDRNEQDEPVARADTLAWRASRSLGASLREEPARLAGFWLANVGRHLRRDGTELMTPLLAALVLFGALAWALHPARRSLARLALPGAFAFAALVAAFYSDRYRLPLVPIYAALAAGLGATWSAARPGSRAASIALHVLLAAALGWEIARNVGTQRAVLAQQPTDVLAIAPVIAAAMPREGGVMSRKGHIGYYSGRAPVPFPRLATLAALGEWAHRSNARFLYYSWYEAQLRPEFVWMLDTTATAPGLEVVAVSAHPPAVAWRIGPEFGREPAWFSDPFERRVHVARARVQVLPETLVAEDHAVLATAAMLDGRADIALEQARRALKARNDLGLAWVAQGWALGETGDLEEALGSFERALALDPSDAVARRALQALATRAAREGGPAGQLVERFRALARRFPPEPGPM